MSRADTELVRSVYEAFGSGDISAVTECFHDDWMLTLPYIPEPGPYRGWEEFARWRALADENLEGSRIEPTEIVDAGEHVLARVRLITKGRASGAETDVAEAHVWTIEDGRVKSLVVYQDESEARAAVRRGTRKT
jgi:ketosteroid isomerase-like protein